MNAWVPGLVLTLVVTGNSKPKDDLADQLRELNGQVVPMGSEVAQRLGTMVSHDVRRRLQKANQRETMAWLELKNRTDWERFRDVRLQALRASLGRFPLVPKDLKVRITGTVLGDGYRIDNLVFESRPGLMVTANLYQPTAPARSMPGILICHSHHAPKTQSELQDMGMTWARLGCLVLVMDQLGHGERRQHPFHDNASYPHSFRVSRQDYYFRYNLGIQLDVIGDSLVGWMLWDLMRGVDLLLSRPGIDKDRILLLGAVAGGGDPAAITAALDPRIAAAVPFNFGGPQPETVYPLPADPEASFNYAGSGSWESTRNLHYAARDGFQPWVIVGAAAPRALVYAHEFAWDREHDPVWARLERIYGWYDARDRLAAVNGRGSVSGKPPDSTHCTNIGPEHRREIYPAFKRWFNIGVPEKEYSQRRTVEELTCLTPALAREVQSRPLHELAEILGTERAEAARRRLADLALAERRQYLRRDWARLLGVVEPTADPRASVLDKQAFAGGTVERLTLEVEPNLIVPVLLLVPSRQQERRLPVIVAFAQEGKQVFLEKRSAILARLLRGGFAVCLPDVRGTGETRPGDARGRTTTATSLASTALMLGQPLLGDRLRDLRSVLRWLHSRPDVDSERLALWGDSFAAPNPPNRNLAVPLDADDLPTHAEPLGGMLALLGALFEDDIRAVHIHGGLVSYASLLQSPFCYIPYDVLVPGAIAAGDIDAVAAALAPRPLRLTSFVDGLNRRVTREILAKNLAEVAHVDESIHDFSGFSTAISQISRVFG
jgi:cephalosporin-C deacetylase-like acetyl esterase